MGRFVDLERGGIAVEPEKTRPRNDDDDDDDYIPDPACGVGVLFGAVALAFVVVILVCYGPWEALGVAAVMSAMDYGLVLTAREAFNFETPMMLAHAARREHVVAPPPLSFCSGFDVAMARERMRRELEREVLGAGRRTGPPPCSTPNEALQQPRRQPYTQKPNPVHQPH